MGTGRQEEENVLRASLGRRRPRSGASSVLDRADIGVGDEVTYRLEVLPERGGDVALEQRHGHPSAGAQLYRVGEAHGAVPGEG